MSSRIHGRIGVTAGLLVATMIAAHAFQHRDSYAPPTRPLRGLPERINGWQGSDLGLERRLVKAIGVDDYLYRRYTNGAGDQVDVYIGYYRTQSSDKLIHSPKNCLPGSGWQPVRSRRLEVAQGSGRIETNEYLVTKDWRSLLVLYWFQGRGRTVASEYSLKMWNAADALLQNRTDGALVRLSTSARLGEPRARASLVEFFGAFYPPLAQAFPR